MPFTIIREDITRLEVDAIVNAANTGLRPGGGVCGAIFAAAGYEALDKACRAIGHCGVGQAVITPGFRLPAKYIVHAVGPIWQGGTQGERSLLEGAYRGAMELAWTEGCTSIAFPLISSGIYGYPKAEAFQVAVESIRAFLTDHDMEVILTVFDRPAVLLGERFYSVASYIDDHYVQRHTRLSRASEAPVWERQLSEQEACDSIDAAPMICDAAPMPKRSLQELMERVAESFNTMLFRLIDEKGLDDVTVYKRSNLDRKLFSKLRHEGYTPSKPTVLALCIGLRLNLDETVDLLGRAGYALSPANKRDVIVEYCMKQGIYDIFEVNELLFAFDQKLLG